MLWRLNLQCSTLLQGTITDVLVAMCHQVVVLFGKKTMCALNGPKVLIFMCQMLNHLFL